LRPPIINGRGKVRQEIFVPWIGRVLDRAHPGKKGIVSFGNGHIALMTISHPKKNSGDLGSFKCGVLKGSTLIG